MRPAGPKCPSRERGDSSGLHPMCETRKLVTDLGDRDFAAAARGVCSPNDTSSNIGGSFTSEIKHPTPYGHVSATCGDQKEALNASFADLVGILCA